MSQLNHLVIPTLMTLLHPIPSFSYPHNSHHQPQSQAQHITPYIFQLNFKPNQPPRRISHHPALPPIQQTPAEDRFFVDGIISNAATIVPKLFGDKPFWVPHAYFNLCPFVRGPDIDPVWSAGCAPLPFPEMTNFNPQNMQDTYTRLQAMQQAQQEQEQKEKEAPSWWEQYRPAGPIDFGMANMYGPVQQQEMYNYGANAVGGADGSAGAPGNARGGFKRKNRTRNPMPRLGMGSWFSPIWG